MHVGVPAEVKPDEYRVALTPAGADELVRRGHRVVGEAGAGAGASFGDDAYAVLHRNSEGIPCGLRWGGFTVLRIPLIYCCPDARPSRRRAAT